MIDGSINRPISIRFSKDQKRYFQKIKKLIYEKNGLHVTTSWIIKRMMACGQEDFHGQYDINLSAKWFVQIEIKFLKKVDFWF